MSADLSNANGLPLPLIDHAVVNVAARMPDAAATFRRLGFTLTPLGRHTLGSVNHLAMFGHDYLELLGVPAEGPGRLDVIAGAEGLSAVAFATNDADDVHAALARAGLAVEAPLAFSRPVTLPEGAREARFRVTRLAADATPAGRLFFCAHATRDLVWRDEWRHHANGALGVLGVAIEAARPEDVAALFRRMFGDDSVTAIDGGLRLLAGLASIDILTPAAAGRRFGAALPPPDGREARMVALVLRSAGLDRTRAALSAGGIAAAAAAAAARVLVPASEAMGVALEFRETP